MKTVYIRKGWVMGLQLSTNKSCQAHPVLSLLEKAKAQGIRNLTLEKRNLVTCGLYIFSHKNEKVSLFMHKIVVVKYISVYIINYLYYIRRVELMDTVNIWLADLTNGG